MNQPVLHLAARSGALRVASRIGAHTQSVFRWNIVLPVLVAILFFGAFTTVYIMMRRPSFGEHGVTHADVVADLAPEAHITSRS